MTHISKFPLPVGRTEPTVQVTHRQALLLLAVAWASGVLSCSYFVLIALKEVL